jgi:hypothetical protein
MLAISFGYKRRKREQGNEKQEDKKRPPGLPGHLNPLKFQEKEDDYLR